MIIKSTIWTRKIRQKQTRIFIKKRKLLISRTQNKIQLTRQRNQKTTIRWPLEGAKEFIIIFFQLNLKNLEKKKDEEIQAKKTEINNMAIEKKKLIAEFEETKKLTAGMKESVRELTTCPVRGCLRPSPSPSLGLRRRFPRNENFAIFPISTHCHAASRLIFLW